MTHSNPRRPVIDNVRFQPGANDIWEQGEPMVRASDGLPLSPDAAEVQVAMKKLGVTSFREIRLTPAAEYLRCLQKAVEFARGRECGGEESDGMDKFMACARKFAGNAGIQFDNALETSIRKLLGWSCIQGDMSKAEDAAQKGDVDWAEQMLKTAEQEALNVSVAFDMSRAYRIVQQALNYAIPVAFKEAEEAAISGDIPAFEAAIARGREYARRLLSSFDEDRVRRIIRVGFGAAFENTLQRARDAAGDGNLSALGTQLDTARKYAAKANRPFYADRFLRTLRNDLTIAAETALSRARDAAGEGHFDTMETALTDVLEFARYGIYLPNPA